MTYTQTQLTELAEQKPDEFVKMIAEVCYGNPKPFGDDKALFYFDSGKAKFEVASFNPISKTAHGRSQAFELADKFGFTVHFKAGYSGVNYGEWLHKTVKHKDPQTAICIAAILTAQELRK